jgi:hypothetical protein
MTWNTDCLNVSIIPVINILVWVILRAAGLC